MRKKVSTIPLCLMMILNAVVIITTISVNVEAPEPPIQEWVVRYNGENNSIDETYDIEVGPSGNIYVTGISAQNTSEPYNYDFATVAYDSSGNELWSARYNGPADDEEGMEEWYPGENSMAVDKTTGNVYVTGYNEGIDGYFNYATVAYNSLGNQLWVARYNGSIFSSNQPWAIAVDDSSGNVYVLGDSNGDSTIVAYNSSGYQLWVEQYPGNQSRAITVDSHGIIFIACEDGNIVTIALNSSGNELWNASYSGPGRYDKPTDITLGPEGNIYITGISDDETEHEDQITLAYNRTGYELWNRTFDHPDYGGFAWDYGLAITTDLAGNIYSTGISPTFNGYNYVTISYDVNGTQRWVKDYNGPQNWDDQAYDITTDIFGNVYVTGESYGNITTVCYDYLGNELWNLTYNGPTDDNDKPVGVVTDSYGNVYVTGRSKGNGTEMDYVTIKYNTSSINETEFEEDSSIHITSGDFQDLEYNATIKSIEVQPEAIINGTLDISINNSGPDTENFIIGATPNWGNHSTSCWEVGMFGPGLNTTTVNVDITAPEVEGLYFLIIAGGWENNTGQLMSATDWEVGELHWDDGNDIANWSLNKLNSARTNGRTIAQLEMVGGMENHYFPADALKVIVKIPSDNGDDFEKDSYIHITSGIFNDLVYDSFDKSIEVQSGALISGTIDISINNSGPDTEDFVIGATPNWGEHSTSYWDVGTFGSGLNTTTVNIDITAPDIEGTYYLVIAGGWENNTGQLMSATDWEVGEIHWEDGNDIANWSLNQLNAARTNGRTIGQLEMAGGMEDYYFPADVLKINIKEGQDPISIIIYHSIGKSLFEITDPSINTQYSSCGDGILKGTIYISNNLENNVYVTVSSSSWIITTKSWDYLEPNPYLNQPIEFALDPQTNNPREGEINISTSTGWYKIIPIKLDDFDIISTGFDITQDAYSFMNWGAGFWAFCYGMSVTSALYFEKLLPLPYGTYVYNLTFEEAQVNIMRYQLSVLGPLLGVGGANYYFQPNNFGDLKEYISNGHPAVLPLIYLKHAVLAYKIIRPSLDLYYIEIYDPNCPYDPDGRHNEGKEISLHNSYQWASWNNSRKQFDYKCPGVGSCNNFYAFKPEINYLVEPERILSNPFDYIASFFYLPGEFIFGNIISLADSILSWFDCPINITVEDDIGRQVGYINSTFTNEVPNAYAFYYGDVKLFILPTSSDYYKFKVKGEANGSYTMRIIYMPDNDTIRLANITNMPTDINSTDIITITGPDYIENIIIESITSNKAYSLSVNNLTNESCAASDIYNITIAKGVVHDFEIINWKTLSDKINYSIRLSIDENNDGIHDYIINITNGMTGEEINELIEKQKSQDELPEDEKTSKDKEDVYLLLYIGFIVIIVGVIITAFIVKRGRSRKMLDKEEENDNVDTEENTNNDEE